MGICFLTVLVEAEKSKMKVPASSESRGCPSWIPGWYLCPAVASSQGRQQEGRVGNRDSDLEETGGG